MLAVGASARAPAAAAAARRAQPRAGAGDRRAAAARSSASIAARAPARGVAARRAARRSSRSRSPTAATCSRTARSCSTARRRTLRHDRDLLSRAISAKPTRAPCRRRWSPVRSKGERRTTMATLKEAPREHPESGFDERFVKTDGFTIRYLAAGSGEPVVYLHGGGGLHISPGHRLLARALPNPSRSSCRGSAPRRRTPRSRITRRSRGDDGATRSRAAGLDTYTLYGPRSARRWPLRVALVEPERIARWSWNLRRRFRPEDWTPWSLTRRSNCAPRCSRSPEKRARPRIRPR